MEDEGTIRLYLYPDEDAPTDGVYQFCIQLYSEEEEFILSKIFTYDLWADDPKIF